MSLVQEELDRVEENRPDRKGVYYSDVLLKETQLNLEVIIPEKLIVVYSDDNSWYDFCFMEWQSTDSDGTKYYTKFMEVSGPSDPLRECRHSYIGNKGYVFYLEKDVMLAILNYLEKYYDLD